MILMNNDDISLSNINLGLCFCALHNEIRERASPVFTAVREAQGRRLFNLAWLLIIELLDCVLVKIQSVH